MNFLAHLHLSGDIAPVMTGNYLGDFVRKKELILSDDNSINEQVLKGMDLHKCIDLYTDSHPLVKKVQQIFIPEFGKYASVLSDLYFDYLLCNCWSEFSTIPLKEFAKNSYLFLENHKSYFNERASQFYGYMYSNNLLENYGRLEVMERVLVGISNRRVRGGINLALSISLFEEHEDEIRGYFIKFYPDLLGRGNEFLRHNGLIH